MKVQLNTDICPIIVPDTYGTDFWANVWDECWNDFKKLMVTKGIEYINMALHETETFKNCTAEAVTKLKSPQYYNYSTDWFDFSIEIDDAIIKRMATMDDKFYDFIKARFSDHPGFHSFMPDTKEKYLKSITGDSDADFARALSEVILYEIDNLEDYQKDYLDDVWEYASSNGMEIDDEESEEN